MESFSKVFWGISTNEDIAESRKHNESLSKITIIDYLYNPYNFDSKQVEIIFNHAKLMRSYDDYNPFDEYILINETNDKYALLSVFPDTDISHLEASKPLPGGISAESNFIVHRGDKIDDLGREIYEKFYKK